MFPNIQKEMDKENHPLSLAPVLTTLIHVTIYCRKNETRKQFS